MVLVGKVVPALALMALIYYLSDQPDLGTDLGWIDTVLRKGAHITIFGLLFLAWARAVGGWPAAAISVLYAVSDELHQSTVDGRHGTPVDVLIDTAGITLAALVRREWLSRRRRAERTSR